MMTAFHSLWGVSKLIGRNKEKEPEAPNIISDSKVNRITVEIDNDMKAKVTAEHGPEFIDALIKTGYLPDGMRDDSTAIMLAMVLTVNEVTEQILENADQGEYD